MSETYWGRVLLQDQKEKRLIGTIIYYETTAPPPARKLWRVKLTPEMDVEKSILVINSLYYTRVLYAVRIYAKPK